MQPKKLQCFFARNSTLALLRQTSQYYRKSTRVLNALHTAQWDASPVKSTAHHRPFIDTELHSIWWQKHDFHRVVTWTGTGTPSWSQVDVLTFTLRRRLHHQRAILFYWVDYLRVSHGHSNARTDQKVANVCAEMCLSSVSLASSDLCWVVIILRVSH